MMATQTARAARPAALQRRQVRQRLNVVAEVVTTKKVAKVSIVEQGTFTTKGTVRKVNEDRWGVQFFNPSKAGDIKTFVGVYDGHGGSAVSDMMSRTFHKYVQEYWNPDNIEAAIETACYEQDARLMQSSGFMGMGERGVGGSKCGSTAANVLLYDDAEGNTQLVAFNVGDSRVLLVQGKNVSELSNEHVPDRPEERLRIESRNPNPNDPLVKFINGTWRLGNTWGYLALSRAFGDAFLKSGYTKGLGLVAEPDVVELPLTGDESYIVVSSDGLYNEVTRGGGGGLENSMVGELMAKMPGASCEQMAEELAKEAVKLGSTDDITCVILKLGRS